MTYPRTLTIRNPQSAIRNRLAFTLTELLVVLAIIVLILAAAVPAFNLITGARSADAAENQVSAMLVRARAAAVRDNRPTGVAFFVNPASGRATMALVTTSTGDESAYYRGWTSSSHQNNSVAPQPTTYLLDQHATAVAKDNGLPAPYTGKLIVGTFSEFNSGGATSSNYPPNRPASGDWKDAYWIGESDALYLDISADAGEFEALPAGVAVQLINDPKSQSARDRYVQTGIILFDAQGRLLDVPYAFKKTSSFFRLLNIPSATYAQWPDVASGVPPFYSQLGLVLYDRATFLNQPGHTEGDSSLLVQGIPSLSSPAAWSTEQTEEKWLDDNTTPLFVNRTNGTLLKGQ